MSATKLQIKIDIVNQRYAAGLNDDDQVKAMIEEANRTKGWTFQPGFDSYFLVTDVERLTFLIKELGTQSDGVNDFMEALKNKGGEEYAKEVMLKANPKI